MRRLLRAGVVSTALALLATACGGSGNDGDATAGTSEQTPSTVAPEDAQQGGHLDVVLPASATRATTLDPVNLVYKGGGSGSGPWYPWAVYGGLLSEDPLSGEVEPSLAESLETTDDGTTWELKLREGLTFSDGTPLDAEAVKFNWDRIADPANGAIAYPAIELWESWTVTDPLTVTITLTAPNLQLPRLIALSFSAIGSPTAIEEQGEDFGARPVGAGPFVVDEFQPGTSLSVTRNPEYFDTPRPYLDSITFRAIADEDQRFRSYEAGEADLSIMLRPSDVARVDELDSSAVVTDAAMASGYAMNTGQAPFDDIRVRQAFVLATDRSILCQARNAGEACGGEGSVPVPDWPFAPETPFYDSDVRFPGTDVDEAQQLVDDYLADEGSESVDVTLTTVADAQIAVDVAQALKSQLDQLDGVDVTIEQAGSDYARNLAAGTYQMVAFGMSDAYPYPTLHDWFRSGGTLNAVTDFQSDEFDDLLDTALAAATPEEAAESYRAFGQALIDEALLIPYTYTTYGLVARSSVHDVVPHADRGVRWDLLWLDGGE
jgi:peptide/nickel transport system substrate-binding protein